MKDGERFVILLRHGIAEPHGTRAVDEARELTSTGHRRMKQISRGLAALFPKPQQLFSSPLIRCLQTAAWVADGYRGRVEVCPTPALRPGASAEELRQLFAATDSRRIICVGHEPTLTHAMLDLTGTRSEGSLELKKGGCYGGRLTSAGEGVLEWMLPPGVLRRC
jgi:phosphohistidine phosphatase SixA